MAVSTSDLSIVYGAVTIGGSTARQITEYIRDEHDFINGAFEFEFVTTASSDSTFASELNTIRNEFRKPRQDLVVTQGSSTVLSRKHSDNTGLNTFPNIVKDGDPADTGRSRHFRVRIVYELPADQTSTNFRRGTTVHVQYSPERRRTVTISGIYTANSTDGSTTASAQYLSQIAAAETTLLNVVDSTATWERVGQPQIEFFETNKVVQFARVYRELKTNQSSGTLDDTDIIDSHLEITVEQIAIDDSTVGGISLSSSNSGGGDGAGPSQGPAQTQAMGGGAIISGGTTLSNVKKPIIITVKYDAGVNVESTGNLQGTWDNKVRPWIVSRAQSYNPSGTLVLIDEQPAYEIYENHISGSMTFMSFSYSIIKQTITYDDMMATGTVLLPTSSKKRYGYYKFPGPAVRQMIVNEETEKYAAYSNPQKLASSLQGNPGDSGLGASWVLLVRDPKVFIKTKGLTGAAGLGTVQIAHITIQTVFQFIEEDSGLQDVETGGVGGGGLIDVETPL